MFYFQKNIFHYDQTSNDMFVHTILCHKNSQPSWKTSICKIPLFLLSVEEEFCQWETFNATCGEGEVIVMRTARYGRMKLGKCLTTDYFVGCSADVLSHVDTRLAFSYTISKESKTRKTFSSV